MSSITRSSSLCSFSASLMYISSNSTIFGWQWNLVTAAALAVTLTILRKRLPEWGCVTHIHGFTHIVVVFKHVYDYPLANVPVTGVVHIQIYQMFLSFNNFQLLIYEIYDYLHNMGVCCGNILLWSFNKLSHHVIYIVNYIVASRIHYSIVNYGVTWRYQLIFIWFSSCNHFFFFNLFLSVFGIFLYYWNLDILVYPWAQKHNFRISIIITRS